MADVNNFPILNANYSIPRFVIDKRSAQAFKNFGQTIDQLAGRGGLTWSETLCVLENRDNVPQDPAYARRRVLLIVDREVKRKQGEAVS